MVHFLRLRPEDQSADYGCRYVRSRGFLVRRQPPASPSRSCLTHAHRGCTRTDARLVSTGVCAC